MRLSKLSSKTGKVIMGQSTNSSLEKTGVAVQLSMERIAMVKRHFGKQ